MKQILITLFVVFTITYGSQAKAEDVWFCQGTHFSEWNSKSNKYINTTPQNFKFSVANNKIKFGSGGFLNGSTFDVDDYMPDPLMKVLTAHDNGRSTIIKMDRGKLNISSTFFEGIVIMSADCDQF